ncbi:OmpA family protein [Croceicoccus sp. Ery15]|uniref:OmpA family protein n=1 Tax=Croceicoccus sp. Ery15 TaxID=1703338 RepID=UPI001E501AD8|nr:OmpA family protein [Croceicoccus sp. Ery15]
MFSIDILTILFWLFVGLAIGGLISWLIGGRTDTESAIGLADIEGKTVSIKEERETLVDQLEAIEGVGPKIAALLHDNGIHRFAQIAAMDPVEIADILRKGGSEFSIARPYTWPFQAKLLANGWLNEFVKVKGDLRAGRLALSEVKGIGAPTAERLGALGIGSVPLLADAEPEKLASQLVAAGEDVTIGNVGSWIDQARRLLMGDNASLAAAMGLPVAVLSARTGHTFKEHYTVAGPIVDAGALTTLTTATASATARPSLLPFWLGLIGAALLGLLSLLGLGSAKEAAAPASAGAPAGSRVLTSELVTDALFETDSAVLTPEGKAQIDEKIISEAKGQIVTGARIVGHADVRGDDALNLTLSQERAQAVADYLKEKAMAEGIDWNGRAVQVFGAGEKFPNPAANTPEDCAALLTEGADPVAAGECFAPDRRVNVDIYVAS